MPKRSTIKPPHGAHPNGVLRDFGITKSQESAYRALLDIGSGTVASLSVRAGLSIRLCRASLVELEHEGLVTHSADRTQRYFPVPPDIAVEALAAKYQRDVDERIRKARAEAHELKAMIPTLPEPSSDERIVEILTRQSAGVVFHQMCQTACRELLCLVRAPMLVSDMRKPDEELLHAMERGVVCRTLFDAGLLGIEGNLAALRTHAAAGEEQRIAANVPFKLVVCDRRLAIVPLNLAHQDGPVLLVRPSSLLDALCEVFDLMWRGGTSFGAVDHPDVGHSESSTSISVDMLLPLLTSGWNDKAIEHELGISHSTLARRISQWMKRLGATTRFQAGWLAARTIPPDVGAD